MKACSPELRAEYAKGSTTISRQWRFERTDGEVITVTTCSRDLLYQGEIYRSKEGVTPTAISQEVGAAVANSEVTGTLSADLATEAEFLAGLWDGCKYTIFEVNYRDLSMGHLLLSTGTLGDLSVGRSAFKAEMRGLAQALQQTTGGLVTKNCTAQLGDDKCKVDLGPFTVSGAVTSVATRRAFTDASRSEPTDWFRYGVIAWLTGANAGTSMEISSSSNASIGLALPMSQNIEVGDTYTMVAGCNKTLKGNQSRYGHVTTDADSGAYTIYDSTRTEPAGTYAGGYITWQSGAGNSGSVNVVASAVGSFDLAIALPNDAYVGDAYVISPPDSVLFNGDCKAKFNNVLNYRGFPNIPGADTVLGLGGTEGTNL